MLGLAQMTPAVVAHPGVVVTERRSMTNEQLGLDFDEVNEEWRPVAGYEGRYEVSNLGRVRSWGRAKHYRAKVPPSPKILRHKVQRKSPYHQVTLQLRKQKGWRMVHCLVLEAFRGLPPSDKHRAAHWDGDPENNRLENLRWATWQENNGDDKRRLGRSLDGERHHKVILSREEVEQIRAEHRTLKKGRQRVPMGTIERLSSRYGVSQSAIYKIVNGTNWRR